MFLASLFLAASLWSLARAEGVVIVPTHAEYSARYHRGIPIHGTAVRELTHLEDGRWEYRFEVNSLWVDIRESVIFDWIDSQIYPQHYDYDRKTWFRHRQATLEFDWPTNRVLNIVGKQPWYLDIHPGVIDKLGYQLQLRHDLAQGKTSLDYQVADGGYLKTIRFGIVREEMLDTRHGAIPTIVVDRIVSGKSKRHTRLWFAKDWHYVLVRLLQSDENGVDYEINLQSARIGELRIGE